jgi:hypothetical protein
METVQRSVANGGESVKKIVELFPVDRAGGII